MESVRAYAQTARGYTQGALNFLNSDGLIPQLMLTVIILISLQLIISILESIVESIRNYNRLQVSIMKDTYDSSNGEFVFDQSAESKYPKIYPSNNEVHGLEFSYSFHLLIDPTTFGPNSSSCGAASSGSAAGANEFRTVFYKGSKSSIWPGMNPGVFVNASTNTMRIYQNAVNGVKESYMDIPNIPVGKWFHVVITQKGQHMDVFINGNVAQRFTFTSIPKINYGNVIVFSNQTLTGSDTTGEFSVTGRMVGQISRLIYYSYALNFAQIDGLYRTGPSKTIIDKKSDLTPPYFHDSWWVTRFR